MENSGMRMWEVGVNDGVGMRRILMVVGEWVCVFRLAS